MRNLTRNLKVIWRTQAMISEYRMSVVAKKTGLMVVAGAIALFGVVMLNMAVFFWLVESMHSSAAALIVAAGNFVFAGLIVLFAKLSSADKEIAAVREVQEHALADIERGAAAVQAEFEALRAEVTGFRAQMRALVSNPVSAISPQMLSALLGAALNAFKKGGKRKK
ncbi:MAG: phage holin family protein [Rhodobacteraceae bacterium]|nr:phage holin family protein [Paracoccaceae bacterium]